MDRGFPSYHAVAAAAPDNNKGRRDEEDVRDGDVEALGEGKRWKCSS